MTGFEVVDDELQRSRDKLVMFRQVIESETSRSAINRTRRAETSVKAMESVITSVIEQSKENRSASMAQLQEENEELERKLETFRIQQETDTKNLESLQHSLERLHGVLAEYRKERDDISGKLLKIFDSAKSVDPSICSVDELVAFMTSNDKGSTETTAEMEAKLVEWNEWSVEITKELETVSANREELREKLESVESELESTKQSAAADKEVIAQVTADLEAQSNENRVLSNELNFAREQNEELQCSMESMKTQLTDLEEASRSKDGWSVQITKELEALSAVRDELRDKLESVESELESTKQSAAADRDVVAQVTADLEAQSNDNRVLSNELSAAREQNKDLQLSVENMKTQLSELEEASRDKDERIRELSVSGETLSIIFEAVKSVDPSVGSVEELIAYVKSYSPDAREMEKKLVEWNEWSIEITKELECVTNENASLETQREELSSRLEALNSELELVKSNSSSAIEENQRIANELNVIRSENAQLKNLSANSEVTHHQLEKRIEELTLTEDRLSTALARSTDQLEALKSELDDRTLSLETMTSDVRLLQSANERLAEEVEGIHNVLAEGRWENVPQLIAELRMAEKIIQESAAARNDLSDVLAQMEIRTAAALELEDQLAAAEKAQQQKVSECSELEAKLVDWNVWSESVLTMLSEKDALIEELQQKAVQIDLPETTNLDQITAELAVRNATIKALSHQVDQLVQRDI